MQNGNGEHRAVGSWESVAHIGDLEAMGMVPARQPGRVSIDVRDGRAASRPVAAPTDIYETEDAIVVVMDLPGHDPATMDLNLEDGVLRIQSSPPAREGRRSYHLAERTGGGVERSFTLPHSVDPDGIDATFEQGVLTVTMSKREDARPRRIEVKSS